MTVSRCCVFDCKSSMGYTKLALALFTVLVATLAYTSAYPGYTAKIPNGDKIPGGPNGTKIKAVGHVDMNGGGPRNQFGIDFKAAGKVWTVALCKKDSDGDGKSNGKELGDPQCVWSIGQTPAKSTDLSHPGVYNGSNDCVRPSALMGLLTVAIFIFVNRQ